VAIRGKQNGVISEKVGVNGKNRVIKAMMGVIRGNPDISRLFGAAKLQSAPGADTDNPRYAAAPIHPILGLRSWTPLVTSVPPDLLPLPFEQIQNTPLYAG